MKRDVETIHHLKLTHSDLKTMVRRALAADGIELPDKFDLRFVPEGENQDPSLRVQWFGTFFQTIPSTAKDGIVR